ncbi:MAG: hypothetical protein O4808_03775, partial [Trichodesmium sp. St17_bin3_1_1]|nr:hypothetical protein [Trichodesmium sp. St17_bin3_1_1]
GSHRQIQYFLLFFLLHMSNNSSRILTEWTVIIRLEKFIPAQLDESMRRHLMDELLENWIREQIGKIGALKPLRSDVKV